MSKTYTMPHRQAFLSTTKMRNAQGKARPSTIAMTLCILEGMVYNLIMSLKASSVTFRYIVFGYRVPLADEKAIHEWFGKPGSSARRRAPDVGVYVKPSKSDLRSPCPAVNTMANHGFL